MTTNLPAIKAGLPSIIREIRTHNHGFSIFDHFTIGCGLAGYIDISYAELVDVLGEPGCGDEYKVEAEWELTDGIRGATIYNYCDGPSYGRSGGPVEHIRDWHIGGDSNSVQMIRELFPLHDVRTMR